jgi:hypothetical protein
MIGDTFLGIFTVCQEGIIEIDDVNGWYFLLMKVYGRRAGCGLVGVKRSPYPSERYFQSLQADQDRLR